MLQLGKTDFALIARVCEFFHTLFEVYDVNVLESQTGSVELIRGCNFDLMQIRSARLLTLVLSHLNNFFLITIYFI